MAVSILIHERQGVEHATHERLEPGGVGRDTERAADGVVGLHDVDMG